MARGGFPGMGGGMGNMQQLMRQAQKMQEDMQKMQEELETRTFTASAGGGAVSVTMSGKKVLQSIVIKKEVVDPEDVEMLQDLVMAAVNEVLHQVEEVTGKEMGKVTGGLGGRM